MDYGNNDLLFEQLSYCVYNWAPRCDTDYEELYEQIEFFCTGTNCNDSFVDYCDWVFGRWIF